MSTDANVEFANALKELKEIEPTLARALEALGQGATVGDLKGVTQEQLEGMYAVAYQLHACKDYEKAEPVFAVLCLLDHMDKRFWLGLADTKMQLGKYEPALEAFGMAAMMDFNNPVPSFQAGMCFLAVKNKKEAANAFRHAVLVAEDSPDHPEYKAKGLAMLELLNEPLNPFDGASDNAQG